MNKNSNSNNITLSKRARNILVAIVSGFVALAIGVTCALCLTQSKRTDVGNNVGGSVSASATNRGAQTGDGFKNLVKNGTFALNDTLTYTSATNYTLNLLPGTYTFKLWGGAGAAASRYCGNGGGGAGGYATGTLTLTAATTIYIYVGGRGSGRSGGYNGGGAGGNGWTTSTTHTYYNAGGGGGGASDIRIGGTAASNRVIVAGGGGGGGGASNGGSSKMTLGNPSSMGTAGGAGGASSTAGTKGGSTGLGSGGGAATTGAVGSGGAGGTSSSTSSDGYYFPGGGGGGGGGYYGGGGGGGGACSGAHGTTGGTGGSGNSSGTGGAGGAAGYTTAGQNYHAGSGGGGGGGSNYVRSSGSYALTGGSTANAQNSGVGKVEITVTAIANSAPTAKTPTVATSQTLGTGKSIRVTANSLGSDPDYSSNTSNTSDTVHLNATTLYLESGCTTNANSYVTYSVSGDTITITALLKLPRSGTNGQANNTLTLYTKIKDDFKLSPATTTVSFKITYATVSANQKAAANKTSGSYTYSFGRSTSANTADVAGGAIVSPTVGEFALTVKNPIKIGTSLTISAADLMAVTAATSYYQVYIVPGAVPTSANGAFSYSGTTATIYNSGGTSMTGYSSLTINAISPSPNWQRLSWTLYVVEKASVGNTNKEPYGATYNSNIGTGGRTLKVTFRVDNTRPTLKAAQNNVVDLTIGKKTDLSLNTYFSDADDNPINTSTHSIRNVIVPANEFVQFDKYGNTVSTVNVSGSGANKSYYNVNGSLSDAMTSGCSDAETGFASSIATKGSAGADAFLMYTFSGITLSVTGLRPSYSQYKSDRAGSAAITGGTNTAPTTTARCVLNPGHFYLLIQITDNNDTTDAGIWLPIAFTVSAAAYGQAPVNTGTSAGSVSGQGTSSVLPNAIGNKDASFYFAPMGMNIGSSSTPVGMYEKDGNLTASDLQPLALDGDNFATANGLSSRTGYLNEFLRITSSAADIAATIGADSNKIATVELIDIYIPQSSIGGRVAAAEVNGIYSQPQHGGTARSGYYYTHGIKITLISTTMNRYFYVNVGIKDITNKPAVDVMIAVKVNDTVPSVKAASSVATYTTEASNAYGTYTAPADSDNGLPTITYRVPLGTTFMITPYDLVSDYDQNKMNGDAGFFAGNAFTLNGMSGVYGGGKFTVGDPSTDPANSVNALFDTNAYGTPQYKADVSDMLRIASEGITIGKVGNSTAFNPSVTANASVYKDRLFFARKSDPAAGSCDAFAYNPTGYTGNNEFSTVQTGVSGYLEVYYGDTVNTAGADRALDFILLRSKIRTQQPAEIRLTVRDRFGAGASAGTVEICVRIEVVNTAPVIGDKTVTNLAVSPVTQGSGDSLTVITPTTASVGVNTIMSDSDGDGLRFMLDRGLIVANRELPRTVTTPNGTAPITSFDEITDLESYTTVGGLQLSESYLTAQLTTEFTLTVAAVNSTRNIEKGVFVYFFVDDGKGGETLGYKQFEVLNTAPVFNSSAFAETGVAASADPVWSIKTVASADINRPRYIVGSEEAATALMSSDVTIGFGAASADIKLLATVADPLQGLILSQKSPAYAAKDNSDTFELAVPSVASAMSFSDTDSVPFGSTGVAGDVAYAARAAVIVSTDKGDGTAEIGAPAGYVVDLLFRVNEKWYTRDELLVALRGGERTFGDVFDEHGRFSVITWAIRLRATNATEGARVKITVTLRDEAEFGGDTFGQATAWTSANNSTRVLDQATGSLDVSFYQTISGTGIITKSEFDEFGGYYVVLDPTGTTTKIGYVSTYDGNENSPYVKNLADIKYDGDLKLNQSGTNVIKGGRNAGSPDGTLAGVNSGQKYKDADSIVLSEGEQAYRYPDTIVVPSTKSGAGEYDKVNVPMSFFGLLQTLASPTVGTGAVKYSPNYVGYDVGSGRYNQSFTLTDLASISPAITLSDGSGIWGGTGDPLSENPYLNIEATSFITAVGANNAITGNGESAYSSEYSIPYYNRMLAVPTLNAKGELIGFQNSRDNAHNFVDDGSVLYLEEQTEKLAEHNFGLTFSKKNMRTGVYNLTLTVKLARSGSLSINNETGAVTGRTVTETANSNPDTDFRTVSVNIRVENSKFDLVTTEDGVKYDADNNTYYTDLTLESAQSQSFRLTRSGAENERYENIGNANTVRTLKYTDTDYQTNSAYRDYAYFMSDTTNRIGYWRNNKTRPVTVENGVFVNTANAATDGVCRAQKSMEYFYGGMTTDDNYIPNDGKYGSNNEKFSRYFSVTTAEEGRILNIMSYKKTYINETSLKSIVETEFVGKNPAFGTFTWNENDETGHGGLSRAQLTEVYASRGLVVEYVGSGTDTEISRVYYPLKIMLYDSCGAGWDDASYVAIEFRICIRNAAPTISLPDSNKDENGNYFYNINLPVETNANVRLSNIISDPDMLVLNGALATRKLFLNNAEDIDAETGDYLVSPYALVYGDSGEVGNPINTDQNALITGNGGLSAQNNTENDVIMWMSVVGGENGISRETEPDENVLWFSARRRTTDESGEYINPFRFTLTFYDSQGRATDPVTFIVNVTNQKPTEDLDSRNITDITMRVGDYFTLFTTYYDNFIGGSEYLNAGGSVAYRNSNTKRRLDEGDIQNVTGWTYSDILSTGVHSAENFITDTSDNETGGTDLGSIGLFKDDTSWRLRFSNIPTGESLQILHVTPQGNIFDEGDPNKLGNRQPIALYVEAVRGGTREMTVTVYDGEGMEASRTFRIRVISSPPVARDPATESASISQTLLEGVPERGAEGYIPATFRLFAVPSGGRRNITVRGLDGSSSVTKTASSSFEVKLRLIAKDPDGDNETAEMSLYDRGRFAVNNVDMQWSNITNRFVSEYFNIAVAADGKSFTIEITGYNPDNDYEELTFYISDAGNPILANTLKVTVQVYTFYSDMINESVAEMSDAQYNAYLAGSHKVNVKAYDAYVGQGIYEHTDGIGKGSTYAFVELDGVSGTDENTSPICDPDESRAGASTYDVKLYAFMNAGNGTPIAASALGTLLTRDRQTETFLLANESDAESYLIGGITVDPSTGAVSNVGAVGTDVLALVNKYVDFSFSLDGTSMTFIPKTSTLNDTVLMYVEVQKRIGQSKSTTRGDGIVSAGSLFALNVKDSAPRRVSTEGDDVGYDRSFSGVKGDSVVFKIYDPADPFGGLFTDSDIGDKISILNFDSDSDSSYERALAGALAADASLDWRADSQSGKARAVTVNVDNDAGTLEIKINRRMDKKTGDDYADSVSFPMTFVGTDIKGESASVTIQITVGNTGATGKTDRYDYDVNNGNVGYSFRRYDLNEYIIDAQILYGRDLTINLADIVEDADYVAGGDVDSFVFGAARVGAGVNENMYLVDEPITALYYTDVIAGQYIELARLSAVGDKQHRTGIKLSALATSRSYMATAYVRILDRASDPDDDTNGLWITINVTVMNAKPYTLEGKDYSTVVMTGSKNADPEGIEFSIDQFVNDINDSDVVGELSSDERYRDTYLRIYTMSYRMVESIYSTEEGKNNTVTDTADSSALFEIMLTDSFNQKFTIRPIKGFFGSGAIDISVADGDLGQRADTLTVTFRINVQVVYNPEEIDNGGLKTVTTARGKTALIAIETIIPDITNTIVNEDGTPSAATFNPASAYQIVDIIVPSTSADSASVSHEDGSLVWMLKALKVTGDPKRINVKYVLKSDPDAEPFENYFLFGVTENYQPELRYATITFKRYPAEDEPIDTFTTLNTDNTVYLRPDQLLDDPEDDLMQFISAKSQKPSLVRVSTTENNMIAIKFNAKGSAKITIEVTDETGESCLRTFTVKNDDLPSPSLWMRVTSSFEANKLVWILLIVAVLILIAVLVIIITVQSRRKREREELEALLVSELEIEEQMNKLAGGPSPTDYQSYGYLPPTQSGMGAVDPSMMLGSTDIPVTQNLALPEGDGSSADIGNPDDGNV